MIGAGIHDLGPEAYFMDPCVEPSLTARGIRTLLSEGPATFAARHPRLSAWPASLQMERAKDFGSVVRKLVLNRAAEIEIIQYPDFKKDAARHLRDRALADGKIPTTPGDYEAATLVAEAAIAALRSHFHRWPIGPSDATIVWQQKTTNGSAWCRTRVNQIDIKGGTLVTLVTSNSVSDAALSRRIANDGCDIHAAFAMAGAAMVLRRAVRFRIAAVQLSPPYRVRVKPLEATWLDAAYGSVSRAADLFESHLRSGEWTERDDESPLKPPAHLREALHVSEVPS